MSVKGGTPYKVNESHTLRFLVKQLDGDLRLSEDPHSPGREFFISAVRDVQQVISDVGVDVFLSDARGHADNYPGAGLRPVELLHIAAAIDATEFVGVVNNLDINDLTSAVRWTLIAVYEDVFSAVGAALESGELKLFRGSLVVAL